MKQCNLISIRAIQVLYALPIDESQKKMKRIAPIVSFVKGRKYSKKEQAQWQNFILVAHTYT